MMPFLLILFSLVPNDLVLVDHVDVIELNHFHDDQGRPVFDQYIFYRLNKHESRLEVCDWKMSKSVNQKPIRDHQRGGYSATWIDPQTGSELRTVTCDSYFESFTQFDPELFDREKLPKEKRNPLKSRDNKRRMDNPEFFRLPKVPTTEPTR